jgi:manganese/zinc/iron transport system permease protein
MNISYNTAIVLCGAGLLGASAGMIGNFAVLRRRALTGDALAHAALPGLCVAFLLLDYLLQFPSLRSLLAAIGIVDSRNLPALLVGALCSGVLGVAVISGLRRWTRIKEDAAIGIVLGGFFGAGIALLRLIQNSSTGNKAGLQSFILGKTAGMIRDDVFLIGGMGIVCLLLVLLLYKEFKLTVFDPGFATAQGWPIWRLDLLVMSLVAVAVVIGLPAVGAILMASMLILPAAAARFWTDRFGGLLVLSAVFGAASGVVGTALSAQFQKLPAGPIIILTGTALFLISVFFAPRRGLIARALEQLKFRRDLRSGKIASEIELPEADAVSEIPDIAASLIEPDVRSSVSAPAKQAALAGAAATTRPAAENLAGVLNLQAIAFVLCLSALIAALSYWIIDSDPLARWTVLIGCLTNIPCAILGCFLVLRRMSLLGDAISHSVLPGIALAFVFTGQITGWPILLGVVHAHLAQRGACAGRFQPGHCVFHDVCGGCHHDYSLRGPNRFGSRLRALRSVGICAAGHH